MSKISIFALVCCVLLGCESGTKRTVPGANQALFFYKVEHEGHKYIVAKWGNASDSHAGAGMVHDPDCPCMK